MNWKDIKLPSSYLPPYLRRPLRFFLLGTTGTFVQTGFFLLAMYMLHEPAKETVLYYVAFGIGFVLEMIPNYFFSNWYTFGTRPDIRNAGYFLGARGINLVIQFVFLPMALRWMPQVDNGVISFVVIFMAGIINFLILRFTFLRKPRTKS